MAPDPQRRAAIAPWFMGLPLEYGLRYGRAWANEGTSAVAVWFLPGAKDASTCYLETGTASNIACSTRRGVDVHG